MGRPIVRQLSAAARDFIDDERLLSLLSRPAPDLARLDDILAKSLAKEPLEIEETADLLLADSPEAVQRLFAAAHRLKSEVYGNRIVLFAPLYLGNRCINDCRYCAFRRSNPEAVRRTLSLGETRAQVKALEDKGHKRLILVFGEHPEYDAEFIAECVRAAYAVKSGPGEIRRVNINAAPFDREGFALIKAAGIGTYQIFMETYHHATYRAVHGEHNRKGDYLWRLDALSRAFEAGQDDIGIGALFGLYDWRFDVLGLVSHAIFLRARYGVGPHTISFPRLQPAKGAVIDEAWRVGDDDFKRLVAILRLSAPYTGMILTARENPEVRREVLAFGVSQIDAGSRIELGGYTEQLCEQELDREQFMLGDVRPLDVVMRELLQDGYVPSFCTACYRKGRTGEHFMEFAVPGFIKQLCTPNALTTLTEYLTDYASPETREAGARLIEAELSKMPEGRARLELEDRLRRIRDEGEHDLLY
ncbi:MAG: [FeFe] hydrogenase H-cluster radical SAM maturase HydG [Myxococcales bacterium]|nr:MAG: [FeFe] hydrogenase H-cluster radical SAM maturase HydG [Myxococcales bacterium]